MTWLAGSLNFFAVDLSLKPLGAQYRIESLEEMRTAVTLTLLFRSLGALVFGLLAERFGRRWFLTLNMLGLGGAVLGTTFVPNYTDFLLLRGAFAFLFGGTYGIAVALALENLPTHTRGFVSGLFQHGYYHGYILAAGIDKTLSKPLNDWRLSFYVGSGLSFLSAAICGISPDSEAYIQLRQVARLYPNPDRPSIGRNFGRSLRGAITNHWKQTIYCIFLSTGLHSLSGISLDSYQKFAMANKNMSVENTGFLVLIGIGGSIVGAMIGGWMSQYLGRRITIIMMCTYAAVFVSLWILPDNFLGLAIGNFLLQFSLQGAWGVVPIHLSELSPPGCIATFVGLTYNLGHMFSSPVPLLQLRAIDLTHYTSNDVDIYQYDLAQGILFGIVAGLVVFIVMFGYEEHGTVLKSVGGAMAESRSIHDLRNPHDHPEIDH
ncbi:hypothetical protein PCASD_09888 [Puccinia coronata f. sp. avenae]|uniref:Major facilitator superfamily (MFS) profile domain-containing protein n=1 Tax=Puccinia coronata f. sp. avenae TaxID=200324 RepID=A0A2N5UI75_9BASI|nr:hypothetical protein PCASD_15717 [Puccinia coronata f. sp. avenae]PLW37397.1 hypothetical protein PCASD_09888 [Puccinia coronata f. sp. avenae]